MADLRPLGSEKLQGMDKIKRILEISKYREPVSVNENHDKNSTTEYNIKLSDGNFYGIVKETKGYILKTSTDSKSWDYMGVISERNYYSSYSQAMKRLNIIAAEVNRNTGYEYETPLIGEQAEPKKKFVLKRKKPKMDDMGGDEPEMMAPPAPPASEPAPPASMPEPPMDNENPDDMTSDLPTDDMSADAPETKDMGGSEDTMPGMEDEEPTMDDEEDDEESAVGPNGLKTIQKLTGRLSQKLRAFDKDKGMDSQDIKYVLNSIISAIDVTNLDDEDREDIVDKIEDMGEYGKEEGGDLDLSSDDDFDMGSEDMEEPKMEDEPSPFTESTVEKVLSKYFVIKENEKPILEEKSKKDFIKQKLEKIQVKKEIRKLSESLSQMESSFDLLKEGSKFVGKTNKENLVFIKNGKQIKVDQRGRII